MSKPISLSIVTILVTIPSVKESAVARGGLVQWYWKGIWVFFRVISIFLVARFTTYHTKSIVYIIFSDVVRETTATAIKFNSV